LRLLIFSKALYSTWAFYAPDKVLFDAGEGVSTNMGNKVFAIKYIFLTHGHADHIAGLWGIVNTRDNAMGDKQKPLYIYYPKGNKGVEDFLGFIYRANPDLEYDLIAEGISKDNEIKVTEKGRNARFIVPFPTEHTLRERSLGYNLVERRTRLKNTFRGLSEDEIIKVIKEKGRDYINETYEKKLLSVSGDCLPIDVKYIQDTDILLHEATFLSAEDRKGESHSTLDEALKVAQKARVKKLILYHISSRYERDIRNTIARKTKAMNPSFDVLYVTPGRIFIF